MMITPLKIRYYGDPCLKKVSDPVDSFDPARRMMIKPMLETMYESDGVGLAAPQVGINERYFIADIGDGPVLVINPEVLDSSGEAEMEEGCLSVPGVNIKIKRPSRIVVRYQNLDNQAMEAELEDLLARVFLHELDHLNGITIIDRAPEKDRERYETQVKNFLSKNQAK